MLCLFRALDRTLDTLTIHLAKYFRGFGGFYFSSTDKNRDTFAVYRCCFIYIFYRILFDSKSVNCNIIMRLSIKESKLVPEYISKDKKQNK